MNGVIWERKATNIKDDVVERLQERLVRKLGLGRRLARNRLTTLLQSL